MNRLTLTGRLFENTLITDSIPSLAYIPAATKNPDEYQRYQPYGEFATEPGDAGTNIPAFTGKFADPGRGNHYFNARYHTSDTGTTKGPMQFSSPDPVYGNLSDPLSWNRYAYCHNNPVMYTDPDGKKVRFSISTFNDSQLDEKLSEIARLVGLDRSDLGFNELGDLTMNESNFIPIFGSIYARDTLRRWIDDSFVMIVTNTEGKSCAVLRSHLTRIFHK